MKQNKQKGSIGIVEVFFITIFLIIIIWVLQLSQEDDINRLEKSDKCFEKLLVKNYDINYETDKINTFMSECMDLKD